MKLSQFKKIKIIVAILLSIVISQSVIVDNYIIPIIAMAIALVFIYSIRRKVDEIISDERDYEIGGKSALKAIYVYSVIGVVLMFVLNSMKSVNPAYEIIASTLAYSVCFLMISYSLIFRYYYGK